MQTIKATIFILPLLLLIGCASLTSRAEQSDAITVVTQSQPTLNKRSAESETPTLAIRPPKISNNI